jgi:protease IV
VLLPKPVAVMRMEGTIGVGIRPAEWLPVIRGARESRWVHAVVLDIDSRGGSAAASDHLYTELRKLAAVKPLVAFTAGTCASGGYLLACAARQLIVQPAAVVGSIGVISVRPLAEELLSRAGLSVNVTKSGKLKDMGAFWRRPTDEEQRKEEAMVQEYFSLFLERIEESRRTDPKKLRKLATGEVFSGRQAVELDLADRVGTFEDAIEVAAAAAQVPARWGWSGPRRGLRSLVLGRAARAAALEALDQALQLGGKEPRY